jgi:hypothetical protein
MPAHRCVESCTRRPPPQEKTCPYHRIWRRDGCAGGFTICAGTTPRTLWTIIAGSQFCQSTQQGTCITDGLGNYGNNERCTVRADVDIYASATEYSVEVRSPRAAPRWNACVRVLTYARAE